MGKVARFSFPWALGGFAIWSVFTADGFMEAIPIIGLMVIAVAAYGTGVTDANEGFIRFQTERTVETFERMTDEDER